MSLSLKNLSKEYLHNELPLPELHLPAIEWSVNDADITKKLSIFYSPRYYNSPRRSPPDLSIVSENNLSNICTHYFNAFAVMVNEFAQGQKIYSIGCGEFSVETKLMKLFPLDISGYDPNCTSETFNPNGRIRMILRPHYDYNYLVGCKKAIIMYCPCGASGSTKLLNEMKRDKPFMLKVNGEFTYNTRHAIYKVVFLGGEKYIGKFYDDY